jgi:hypothetical protein
VRFVCLPYELFGGLFGLHSSGGEPAVDEDVELVVALLTRTDSTRARDWAALEARQKSDSSWLRAARAPAELAGARGTES